MNLMLIGKVHFQEKLNKNWKLVPLQIHSNLCQINSHMACFRMSVYSRSNSYSKVFYWIIDLNDQT